MNLSTKTAFFCFKTFKGTIFKIVSKKQITAARYVKVKLKQ